MGMFDSIYMKVKCPKCGYEATTECQTKDAECLLSVYEEGDEIAGLHENSSYVNCIVSCDACQNFYDLKIFIDNKKVTSKYEII